MKLITEAELKAQLQTTKPRVYYIPEGRILSPAARDYLNQQLIQIEVEKNRPLYESACEDTPNKETERIPAQRGEEKNEAPGMIQEDHKGKNKYTDYETGAGYIEKPEFMTHMYGNQLICKDDPMIQYRGKLDRIQAEIVLAQSVIAQNGTKKELVDELGEILGALRELMRCELMQEPVEIERLIGLNREELREHSHHTSKYYGIKTMELPEYGKGIEFALLNLLRTSVRETEILAVAAFRSGHKVERKDIIEVLNRLSSALHIMMCKYIAGEYEKRKL